MVMLSLILMVLLIIIGFKVFRRKKTPQAPPIQQESELCNLASSNKREGDIPSSTCLSCYEYKANMVNYKCGHVTYCSNCTENDKVSAVCPTCHANVDTYIKSWK